MWISCEVLLYLRDNLHELHLARILAVIGVPRFFESKALQAILHVFAVLLAGRKIAVELFDCLIFLVNLPNGVKDGVSEVDGDVVRRIEVANFQ